MRAWFRISFTFVCISAGLLSFAKAYGASDTIFEGEVAKVVDGDTIHFLDHETSENAPVLKIRMTNIDAPETSLPVPGGIVGQGPYGKAATQQLDRLIPVGTEVRLVSQGFDKYRRVLGRLYYKGRDVNLQMVRLGWAIPYIICEGPRCNRNFFKRENIEAYFRACDEARKAGRGIWNSDKPLTEMPFEFRLRMQRRKPDKPVGDYDTRKLYEPTQYKKVDVCRRVFFLDEEEAFDVGFDY